MTEPVHRGLVQAIGRRDRELAQRLGSLDDEQLRRDSALPGWSVLTIACHLRYGAEANLAVTEDMLADREASYYPLGRTRQREATLRPKPDESSHEVVASLVACSEALHLRWRTLSPEDWGRVLAEPADNVDLGPVSLGDLAILRLTEVEVHGTDLGLGLAEWSEEFVAAGLAMRLHWLAERRSNHRSSAETIDGTWWLRAVDGSSVLISSKDGRVQVEDDMDAAVEARGEVQVTPPGVAIIEASGRDLLAFLLGRADPSVLTLGGDRDLAARFRDAFPPP